MTDIYDTAAPHLPSVCPPFEADNPGTPPHSDADLPAGASPENMAVADWAAGVSATPAPGQIQVRQQARQMFWAGFQLAAIARALDIKRTTLHGWAKADGWGKARPVDRVVGALEVRLAYLIGLPVKTGQHFKEIDLLGRQMERLTGPLSGQAAPAGDGAARALAAPDTAPRRRARPTRKEAKNHFEQEHIDALADALHDEMFDYQKRWFTCMNERVRLILKSRQIGATWYFAREALIDLLQSDRSQIFLSASRAQAHQFKNYQRQFVRAVLDMDLEGDPIVFSSGAVEFFLGRNIATAQSYSGNLYFDEIYWVPNFGAMESTAGAMATHKRFRKTYFSTPSVVTHDAYDLWTGERYNTGRPKNEQVAIDLSHQKLVKGQRGADGIWRNRVTIEDAVAQGLDLVDLEQIRRENAPAAYRNLYMCEFVDDETAVFPYEWLKNCGVDSWDEWKNDFAPYAPRPFGYRGVWVGYDPSGGGPDGDACGLVVVAPPENAGGDFRVLEFHRLHNNDFSAQADFIKKITDKFTVLQMAIDVTGLGRGVCDLVKRFYPAVTEIHYSPETKARLVMGAQNVMRKSRLKWDAGAVDLVQSFMAIKHGATAGGRLSYVSGRRKKTGHADLAWALMNALVFEPLGGSENAGAVYVGVYESGK